MIYIGGYATEKNQGIYLLNDDLSFIQHICDEEGTSYFDVDEMYIYTIIKRQNQGGIAVFDHDGQKKAEVLVDKKPGCFIQKYKQRLYCAYYHDDCVQIYDLKLHLCHEFTYPQGSKCHHIDFFEHFFAVSCLGLDKIFLYDYEYHFLDEISFPKNSGPRHMVHTKDEQTLFVISELSNELFVMDMNKKKLKQTLSIIENDQWSIGAAIRLSEDEQHLYTSTRGQDLIKHFVYDHEWKEKQCVHMKGQFPRDFKLEKHALIVGYQKSDFVEKIQLDENGDLSDQINAVSYEQIVCVK